MVSVEYDHPERGRSHILIPEGRATFRIQLSTGEYRYYGVYETVSVGGFLETKGRPLEEGTDYQVAKGS